MSANVIRWKVLVPATLFPPALLPVPIPWVGTWYSTSSTRELSCGGAKHARVRWAMGMHCGMALGGVDTLGSGSRGDRCGVGVCVLEE